jgi:hypothetical protein
MLRDTAALQLSVCDGLSSVHDGVDAGRFAVFVGGRSQYSAVLCAGCKGRMEQYGYDVRPERRDHSVSVTEDRRVQ